MQNVLRGDEIPMKTIIMGEEGGRGILVLLSALVERFGVSLMRDFFCYLSGVFHYFGHHGRSASQIFNQLLSFEYLTDPV